MADGLLGQRQARLEVLDGERRSTRFRRTAALMQSDIDAFIAQTRDAQHATYVTSLATLAVSTSQILVRAERTSWAAFNRSAPVADGDSAAAAFSLVSRSSDRRR